MFFFLLSAYADNSFLIIFLPKTFRITNNYITVSNNWNLDKAPHFCQAWVVQQSGSKLFAKVCSLDGKDFFQRSLSVIIIETSSLTRNLDIFMKKVLKHCSYLHLCCLLGATLSNQSEQQSAQRSISH